MAGLKTACLIEKWMEKKVISSPHRKDNDHFFYSSSSSDSSSGGFSSSDTQFFASAKSRKSCSSSSSRPKPIRTSVLPQLGKEQNEFLMFSKAQESNETEKNDNLIKSKYRALKIYANYLKKVKQPISPGSRLTSFINNLFTNGNAKKSKNSYEGGSVERSINQVPSSSSISTCSSASSFSRSCLSKNSSNSRAKRTVRFYPVSVIFDEDCRPCGHKRIYDQDSDKFCESAAVSAAARDNLKPFHQNQKVIQDHEEEDYDDGAASDSSSDLFEIDHLALFRNNRFREELPVYETTHLHTNRAIANGLIC
ncbi:hypothetical protein ACH5RR_039934 [Cinchona calisaya]|uniref:Protein BIG GRAIN 1-like A n=1 Tax=Cinchona calisaya TaxID=153742 RepID=A0ABD2XZR1_9GENT